MTPVKYSVFPASNTAYKFQFSAFQFLFYPVRSSRLCFVTAAPLSAPVIDIQLPPTSTRETFTGSGIGTVRVWRDSRAKKRCQGSACFHLSVLLLAFGCFPRRPPMRHIERTEGWRFALRSVSPIVLLGSHDRP